MSGIATIPSALAVDPVSVTAAWEDPAQAVFDSDAGSCDRMDIPDQSARAFRDASGQVHLFSTHFIARAL